MGFYIVRRAFESTVSGRHHGKQSRGAWSHLPYLHGAMDARVWSDPLKSRRPVRRASERDGAPSVQVVEARRPGPRSWRGTLTFSATRPRASRTASASTLLSNNAAMFPFPTKYVRVMFAIAAQLTLFQESCKDLLATNKTTSLR